MKQEKLLEIIDDRLDFIETVIHNAEVCKIESKSRAEDNITDGHLYRLKDEKKFLEWVKEIDAKHNPPHKEEQDKERK